MGLNVTTPSYINDPGFEVPSNKILIVPSLYNDVSCYDVVESLIGNVKRDWFNSHFYYCLPLTIGNQYGFLLKSSRTFEAFWEGGESPVKIKFLDTETGWEQIITNHFYNGVITFQNRFAIKTPPGINIMTIQPPNMYIPGTVAMMGVVETDQIRRDFTFSLKVTVPNYKIVIKKGDPIGAFMPIPRYFVDQFSLGHIKDYFDKDIHEQEVEEAKLLGKERSSVDFKKPHSAGRRYFNGVHTSGEPFLDHQKHMGGGNKN